MRAIFSEVSSAPSINECRTRFGRLLQQQFAGGLRTQLLITGDQDPQPGQVVAGLLEDRCGVQRHDHPGEHVEHAGAAQRLSITAERLARQGSDGPDSVLAVDQHHRGLIGAEAQPQVGGTVDDDTFGHGAQTISGERGDFCGARGDRRLILGRGLHLHQTLQYQ